MGCKTVLFNDTRDEKHIGCIATVTNLIKFCKDCGIEIVKTYSRKNIKEFINLEQVKFIIINGEGTFYNAPEYFIKILDVLEKYNLQAIILNTVWQKMFGNFNLDRIKLIAFRESLSFNDFKSNYPDFKGETLLTSDMIFYSNYEINKLGFGDSVLSGLKRYLKQNNYMPFQYIGSIPDVYAYLNWLSSLELYITGRFHGIVLSIIAETPFLAFPSTSHKVESLLKDLKCEDLLINSLSEIEAKRELAKTKIDNFKMYKLQAKKRLDILKNKLKEVINEK